MHQVSFFIFQFLETLLEYKTLRFPNPVPTIRSAGPSPNLSRQNSFRKKEEPNMKISTGTRQLRDHELSYFGVNKSETPTPTTSKITNSNLNSSSFANVSQQHQKSLATPPSSFQAARELVSSTPAVSSFAATFLTPSPAQSNQKINQSNKKWQLTSEKPDLIKALSMEGKKDLVEELGEPIYQNIQKISSPTKYGRREGDYNRKLDLERDERILDELTRVADEIANVSD
jgi:hypothetical protein